MLKNEEVIIDEVINNVYEINMMFCEIGVK